MDVRRRDALAHGLGAASLAALGAMGLPGCATPGPATPDDALGADDALGVAARIKAKEITALEAVDAAIARAERLEPKINAIVTRTFEDARERARAGAASGPFAGVPMLVKDLSDVAGQPTRFGCRGYRDAPPAAATDRFVAQAFAAGLISIGKSTTPEFGYTATTEPLLTGPTRNPWNLAHSAGGSSGGSAAAVAAGVAPIATASDGGGSIRIPASCCGLFGLKPSRGRLVGSEAPSAPVPISVAGCLSRSVRDAAAFLAATERADTPYPAIGLVTGPAKARLRVGLIIDAATGVAPDPEVRAATLSAAALCADLGHSVRETAYPFDGEAFTRAFTLYWSLGAAEVVAAYRKLYPEPPLEEAFEPLTLHLLRHAAKASRAEVDSAIAVLRRAGQQQAAMFDGLDVILTPVLLTPPPALGHLDVSLPFEENQARIARYVGYTPFENAAGAPAMSAPLGWSRSGLPIGAHFTARPGAEATLLALAYELEAARPWAQRRPRL